MLCLIQLSFLCDRAGGRLAWFGVAATARQGIWVIPSSLLAIGLLSLLPGKQVPLTPHLGEYSEAHSDWYRGTLAKLLDLLASGQINPLVAECFPLVEAARAHTWIERGGYAGKVVLVTGAGS